MAISIRDNLNPIVQEAQAMMARNEVGQPSFTRTIDGKTVHAYESQTLLFHALDVHLSHVPGAHRGRETAPALVYDAGSPGHGGHHEFGRIVPHSPHQPGDVALRSQCVLPAAVPDRLSDPY